MTHERLRWTVAVVGLGFAVNVTSDRILSADGFYDLYAGRFIVRHGIPHHNVLTVASHGAPWVDQQWLAHLAYYAAWAAGGYPALAALSAVLVTSGFAVLGMVMLARGVPPARMFAWTTAALVACIANTVIRAQSFAYPLFALTLWLVVTDSQAARPRARTWLLVPVLVVWANTHGSVLVGAGLVVGYAAFRALARLREDLPSSLIFAALGVAAAASVVCTPYGTGVLAFYARVASVTPALSHDIPEWSPPTPLSPLSWGFFGLAIAVAAVLALAWRRGTRPDPLLAAGALVLFGLALTAIRNQVWFAFAGSLLAADTLARSGGGRVPALSQAFVRAVSGVLAAAALAGLVILAVTPDRQFEGQLPLRAIATAAAVAGRGPAARILGDDACGSAMLWLHPGTVGRVGFDARLEQYTLGQINAYAGFLNVSGRAWQRVMGPYDTIVVSRVLHHRLASALARLPGWRVVYSDGAGLVVERRAGLSRW